MGGVRADARKRAEDLTRDVDAYNRAFDARADAVRVALLQVYSGAGLDEAESVLGYLDDLGFRVVPR